MKIKGIPKFLGIVIPDWVGSSMDRRSTIGYMFSSEEILFLRKVRKKCVHFI